MLGNGKMHYLGTKILLLAVIPFLLTAFSPRVFADEPSWATPSDIQFRNIPVSDRIIPLGFSKKGVFSYILQQNSCHASSGNKGKLSWIAVDLITDKVLKHIDLGKESPDVSAEDVLQKHAKTIGDYNSQYKIVTTNSYVITASTAIESENEVLAIQTELVETIEGEDAVNPGYRKYKIILSSESKGTKTLAEIISVYEPLRYWGYFKSPFEERITALFISDFRGCEAYPQMHINIVGAHLIRGFKAKIREFDSSPPDRYENFDTPTNPQSLL